MKLEGKKIEEGKDDKVSSVADLNVEESLSNELYDVMRTHLAILDDNDGRDKAIIKGIGG